MFSLLKLWFPLALLAAWIIAWFAVFLPWLRTYHLTAGIMARLQAGEATGLHWLALKLQGAKTALLLFVTSLFTGAWGMLEAAFGVDPSALAPFQDSGIWKALLHDEMALRAAALTTFAAAFLTLYGKVRDVKIAPKVGVQ